METPLDCRWVDDLDGRCIEVRTNPSLEGAHAIVRVYRGSQGTWLKAAPGFADSQGDFCLVAPLREGLATLHLPWGAAMRQGSDPSDILCVDVVVEGEDRPRAHEEYEAGLAMPRPYRRVDVFRPFIGMAMAVAFADGELRRSEVTCLRTLFQETLGIPEEESPVLKELMRLCPPEDLRPLAIAVARRAPWVAAEVWVKALGLVAEADGRATPDEIAIVEQVATCLNAGFDVVRALRESASTGDPDPWAVLGLQRNASEKEVKQAYYTKLKQYHPDKWANAPEEMQKHADMLTKRYTAAFNLILSSLGTVDDGPSLPRPSTRATYAAYGVDAGARWVRPAARKPAPDLLSGMWTNQQGGFKFVRNGEIYHFVEFGPFGLVGQGAASLSGNIVTMQGTNVQLGGYQLQMQLNGHILSGSIPVLGFPIPIVLYRA